MPHSRKDIFIKCWIWSIVSSMLTAAAFWLLTSFGNIFRWEYGGTVFMDLLVGLSVVGGYVGAGYIGWSLVDKYYPGNAKFFLREYRKYSIYSFLGFIAITFTPLSILGLLWSIMAPACVLMVLAKSKQAGLSEGLPLSVVPFLIPEDVMS
jgi:hypothetical protein